MAVAGASPVSRSYPAKGMYGCAVALYGTGMGAQINRGSAVPLYQQLAAILRAQIAAGELTGRGPSQNRLAAEYGVSVDTARKALAVLRGEGLIETYVGSGWEVVPPGP